MNSDIPLETAAIFFLWKLNLKQSIITRAARITKLQNETFLPTVVFESGTFGLRSTRSNDCATKSDTYRTVKSLAPFICVI